jgi:hypothetical protein
MMSNFGALTDHWGILDLYLAGEAGDKLSTVLEITASSKVPDPLSRAEALDRNGDPVAATWHGNEIATPDFETLYDASVTYVCKSGSFSLNRIKGGEIVAAVVGTTAGKVIDGFDVGTSNDEWPSITATGKIGTRAIVAPTFPLNSLNTWTLPDITITGAKRAQLLDFTVDAACELTASGLTAALDLAQQEDGVGEPCAHGISGGLLTLTCELVRVTGACAWTPGETWTETQKPGADEGQAAYHTASGAAEKIWVRNTSA